MNMNTTDTTLPAVPNTLFFFLTQQCCPQGLWVTTNTHNEINPKKKKKKSLRKGGNLFESSRISDWTSKKHYKPWRQIPVKQKMMLFILLILRTTCTASAKKKKNRNQTKALSTLGMNNSVKSWSRKPVEVSSPLPPTVWPGVQRVLVNVIA